MVVSFFLMLHSPTPSREGPDGLRWRLRKNGVFDTRFYYNSIRGSNEVRFPWKGICVCVCVCGQWLGVRFLLVII